MIEYKNNKVLTPAELSEYLRVGMNVTYSLLKSGEIKARRIGKKWIIPMSSVEEFLNEISP